MKILRLSAYYWPERISASHLIDDLEAACVGAGFQFEIYCPTPTRGISEEVRQVYRKKRYEERAGGNILIHRFAMFREGKNPVLRAIRYILVHICQYRAGCTAKDIGLILGISTPPTQGILCGCIAKKLRKQSRRRVPFIYCLQDMFPDSLAAAGFTHKGSMLYRIGQWVEKKTYLYADQIIVISNDMRDTLLERGVPARKIEVVYNWIDTDKLSPVKLDDNPLARELGVDGSRFQVVYAGNLGLVQGVDTLIAAAAMLRDEPVDFLIFGTGAEEEKLKKMASNCGNVRFFPLQPMERAAEVYSIGDCCAVLCRRGAGGVGVPSKTWSILACGRPVLVSFDQSELTKLVEEAHAGLCSPAGDAAALAENIRTYMREPALRKEAGTRAREYAVKHAGRAAAVQKYVEILKEAGATNP